MMGQGETARTSALDIAPRTKNNLKDLNVTTYNVRTLRQPGKLHQLTSGCDKAGIHIVGIQEHRLITTDEICHRWEENGSWLLLHASCNSNSTGGVGLLLKKDIAKHVRHVEKIDNRIMLANFEGNPSTTVIVLYAPTEAGDESTKVN